jgi:TolB-like protein/DNA-binding winged helix-turn-helix (wHTH) protein/thioredoxin-like negative regulator of GroEL
MGTPSVGQSRLTFGLFEADLSTGELCRTGHRVALQEKPFRILALLLERHGEVVTREEVRKQLWPVGTFVDFDEGLDTAVRKLRYALGDSAQNPTFIETIPRRGYRFIAPVSNGTFAATPSMIIDVPSSVLPSGTPTVKAAQNPNGVLTRYALPRIVAGTVGALVILLAGLTVWRVAERRRSDMRIRSIAVLPLENLSGDAAQDYFADGMTEELITEIGQIQPLRVISRTSVMQYKGVPKPLPLIAHELNVDAIVVGSVVRSGEQVRITAQLVEASSEKQLWAKSYQRGLKDILGVQSEIAGAIGQQIQRTLRPPEPTTAEIQRTISPEAYQAYWKGEILLDKLQPDSVQKAAEYFQEAIAESPEYVAAYTKLSGAYGILGNMGVLPEKEAQARVKMLTAKALEIDPLSGPAHAQKGWDAMDNNLDIVTAGAEFKKAVDLNPNGVEGHEGLGEYYAAAGQTDNAVRELRRARELDPLSFIVNEDMCRILYYARRFDEALAQCKANLNLDPPQRSLWQMAHIYVAKGMDETAASTFIQAFERSGAPRTRITALKNGNEKAGLKGLWQEALRTDNPEIGKKNHPPLLVAIAYTYAGDKDKAFLWLDRAFDERSFGIAYLRVDPTFDSLHSDVRFQNLLRRMPTTTQ